MSRVIHVGLIEDQSLFREGMKAILSANSAIRVVFESAEGYTAVEQLKSCQPRPEVLLVDYSLPPLEGKEFTGVDTAKSILESFPDIRILILSVHNNENFIAEVIEQGAHGYLVKDCNPQEVFDAIQTVHEKGSYVNATALRAIQNNLNKSKFLIKNSVEKSSLSSREIEVLKLICLQHTAEEIAEKLFISVKTVNGHRTNLLQKTNSKNMAGLVVYAVKNHIVDLI